MTSSFRLGLVLSALMTAASVTGNLANADRHLVSTFPTLMSLAIMPTFLLAVLRFRARSGATRAALQTHALGIGGVGALVFSLALTVFSATWFTAITPRLIGTTFAMSLAVTGLIALVSARVMSTLLGR